MAIVSRVDSWPTVQRVVAGVAFEPVVADFPLQDVVTGIA